METTRIAQSDLEVSRACMGTMTFGSQTDASEAERIVGRCLDAGINFFDTANIYNQGRSEEILGRALGPRRQDVVLASKARGAMGDPVQYAGLSRHAIRRAIEESLRRLNTQWLDIYYLHQPDGETPIEETLGALEELRAEGKIRYPATSNYAAWQIGEMHAICEGKGWAKPWISQPMYNLLARGIEQEYLAFTARAGVTNVVYNPLAGGLLTGKQSKGAPLPGTRFDANQLYLDRYWHDPYFDAVAELQEIARAAGLSLVQLAFAWLLQQQHAHCIILGASRLEQIEENLAALEAPSLDADTLAGCDRVWRKLRGPAPNYNR
jgi:aryl-alcohol dehydrogenase-like predicted oxidoreductase